MDENFKEVSIMTSEQKRKCESIIHSASIAAGAIGAGLAQIPMSDNAVIVPIQCGMIISLGAVFGVSLTESTAKSLLATEIATNTGRAVSQVLFGWMPGFGNVLNSVTAAGVTESIGWAIAADFDRQGNTAIAR